MKIKADFWFILKYKEGDNLLDITLGDLLMGPFDDYREALTAQQITAEPGYVQLISRARRKFFTEGEASQSTDELPEAIVF